MTEVSTAMSIRGLRRQQRLSQEALAERAGLSTTTIKKAESGRGYVSTRTLHAIARALDVDTRTLYITRSVAPRLADEPQHQALADLRAAISPPLGIDGDPMCLDTSQPVDLEEIEANVWHTERDYRADHYDAVADALPPILYGAHRGVAEVGSSDAHRVRARALQMAGRYLTQVRQLDLALTALHASIQDAAVAGDRTLAAISINGQGWALVRQGRLSEAEALCIASADDIEPRVSTASKDELAAWGNLLFRASSAAIRNNHPDRARDLLRVAASAASALGKEHESWATFGPMTVALKGAEFELIAGKPDLMLRAAEHLPDPREVGRVTPLNWHRHQLDVAEAHAQMHDADSATEVLIEVMEAAPEWMRRQAQAYSTVQDIMGERPKKLTEPMARLASHLGVAA